jgi:hypothetical protein
MEEAMLKPNLNNLNVEGKMKKQIWFCESCGAKGEVNLVEGEGVFSVITKFGDNHKRLSTACVTGINKIRVIAADVDNSVDK